MGDPRDEVVAQIHSLAAGDEGKKAELINKVRAMPNPLATDRWIYRLVVMFLGLSLLATVGGGIFATVTTGTSMPEGLVALGSAAVGALAGLLAPSPVRNG